MIKKLIIFIICILAYHTFCFGSDNNIPPEIKAVKKYILEEEYLELFGEKYYRFTIENAVISDIDNDGDDEVILHLSPHYLQSATIIIYQLSNEMSVSRVIEGLAPGPLEPISRDYLDCHTLRMGTDIDRIDQKGVLIPKDDIIKASSCTGNLVIYKNFFHIDSRSGKGAFIDMTDAIDFTSERTCEKFEFSKVKQITIGKIKEDKEHNYLAVWVGNEIYIYLVESITKNGFLNKKYWIKKAPLNFEGLVKKDEILYTNISGSLLTLSLNN